MILYSVAYNSPSKVSPEMHHARTPFHEQITKASSTQLHYQAEPSFYFSIDDHVVVLENCGLIKFRLRATVLRCVHHGDATLSEEINDELDSSCRIAGRKFLNLHIKEFSKVNELRHCCVGYFLTDNKFQGVALEFFLTQIHAELVFGLALLLREKFTFCGAKLKNSCTPNNMQHLAVALRCLPINCFGFAHCFCDKFKTHKCSNLQKSPVAEFWCCWCPWKHI